MASSEIAPRPVQPPDIIAEKRPTFGKTDESKALGSTDEFLVQFSRIDAALEPYSWSARRKRLLLANLTCLGFSTNLSYLLCAPATPQILADLHSTSNASQNLIVSIWSLGAVVGCLFTGPLSELYGRLPVYHFCNISGLALVVGQAQVSTVEQLIALRFLNGMLLATTILNPSVVGDIFKVEERGVAQSIMAASTVIGTVIGPVAGGYIAQTKGWRWTFWVALVVTGFFVVTMLVQFRETYGPQILRREAARRRYETGDPRWHSKFDQTGSVLKILLGALVRPIKCFSLPIILLLVFPFSFVGGNGILLATNIPLVFQNYYELSEGQSGLTFLGYSIGMVIGALFCSGWLDRYTTYMKRRNNDQIKPEWRLPPALAGLFACSVGLFWFGWSAYTHSHPAVPILGSVVAGIGAWIVQVPVRTYIADAFGIYRASAISALITGNNVAASVLPLAGPPLYKHLGLGWGNSVLAFVALAFVPVLFVMLRYGESLRERHDIEKRLA